MPPIIPEVVKLPEELVVKVDPPSTVLLRVIAPEEEVKMLFPVNETAPV